MVTAIEPQDVGTDTDASAMESAAWSESSNASEIPPPIDSPNDSSDAMSMFTPDDADDVNVGGIGLDDDDAEATGASNSVISPGDGMPGVDPDPVLDLPDFDDVDGDDQDADDDAPLDLGLGTDDTGFGSGGLESTDDDDDGIKNALADYGDEKYKARENSAVKSDKSMEYKGMPKEPMYKARGGRGKIRF